MQTRLCECGCGALVTYKFVRGHNLKKNHPPWWKGDKASYGAKHHYLNKYFPRKGICQECGEAKTTEYALIHGREHSRDPADYQEMCKRCHNVYDHGADRGPAPSCACGCGQPVTWYRKTRDWHRYAKGHYRNPVGANG